MEYKITTNKASEYCLQMILAPRGMEEFFWDSLVKRLLAAHRQSIGYIEPKIEDLMAIHTKCPKSAGAPRNLLLEFSDWLIELTPKELECEFNSHEIMELLIPAEVEIGQWE